MDLYRNHLEIMDNYSEFCREAIEEKLDHESDEEYLKTLRKEHHEKIKEIDEKLKASKKDPEEVKKILENSLVLYKKRHFDPIKEVDIYIDPSSDRLWIRESVLPKLKKVRCNKFSEYDLLKMFESGDIHEKTK